LAEAARHWRAALRFLTALGSADADTVQALLASLTSQPNTGGPAAGPIGASTPD